MKTPRQSARIRAWAALVLGFALPCLAGAGKASAGQVIDRIVAVVDHHVILESQWEENIRFECLMNGRPPESLTPEERYQSLDRLIDQELIAQQMEIEKFPHATPAEIAQRLANLRTRNPQWASDPAWNAALAAFGLSPVEVDEQVGMELDIFRFINKRFRPDIHIDEKAIQTYYLEQLIPSLHREGAREVPLQEVEPKIEELLVQQRMDQLLSAWLKDLRSQTEVQMR